jgi:hypothetical protein
MDATILDEIPLVVEAKGLANFAGIMKMEHGDTDLEALLGKARKVARPRAYYRIERIEEKGNESVTVAGETFTSRVLRVNLDKAHRVFPFVITCGTELEEWSNSLRDTARKLWADTIKGAALFSARQALVEHIKREHAPGKTAMMNPGSIPDWPITEQAALFRVLGDVESAIGVKLLDSGFMTPALTASGILFPAEYDYENCRLCPMEDCPGRRAEYDDGLFKRRYEGKSGQ